MYDGTSAGWGHWVGVPIVFFAVELLVCRNIRVNAGAPEKIACDNGLVCEVVPQLMLDFVITYVPTEVTYDSQTGDYWRFAI